MRMIFVSSLTQSSWGAAEELWFHTAMRAAAAGHDVSASVHGWRSSVRQHEEMKRAGIDVETRVTSLGELIVKGGWDLVVISQPDLFSGQPWTHWCRANRQPYVVVIHYAASHEWCSDADALGVGAGLLAARRCFFISKATWQLAEIQTGNLIPDGEVVQATYRVAHSNMVSWPVGSLEPLRLAIVARIDAADKGHDLLIALLGERRWRERDVRLSVFGRGPHEDLLRRMADRLARGTIDFCGSVDNIENLWARHHVLVLPSRAEGLPAALVEAMLCGRPAVVTDVGGMAEVVKHGDNGFVAASPTLPALADAMEELWRRRHDLEGIGRRGRDAMRMTVASDPASTFLCRLTEIAADVGATS